MAELDVLAAHWQWEGTDCPGGASPFSKTRDGARRAAYRAAAARLAALRQEGVPDQEALHRLAEAFRGPVSTDDAEAAIGATLGRANIVTDLEEILAQSAAS